jgi:hypothetical protein
LNIIILIQSRIRGLIVRSQFKLKLDLAKKTQVKNPNKLLKSIEMLQSYWRGYLVRKSWHNFKLEKNIKEMQMGYFCQQVINNHKILFYFSI